MMHGPQRIKIYMYVLLVIYLFICNLTLRLLSRHIAWPLYIKYEECGKDVAVTVGAKISSCYS
jgi:hypothetical protein